MSLVSEERVLALDPVFGPMGIEAGHQLWNLPELTPREKAILLIAADVRVPELGLPFELHVEMALTKIAMPAEHLREILRHIAPDAGFNITAMAFQKLAHLLSHLGEGPALQPTEPVSGGQDPVYERPVLKRLDAYDPEFATLVQMRSTKLWSRPYLGKRERAFATLAVDVIAGTLGSPFHAHLAIAYAIGIEKSALMAMLRLLAEFSIPRAWQAHEAIAAAPELNRGEEETWFKT